VSDLGKLRLYHCPSCGLNPARPLVGSPKPCDVCGADLSHAPYTVEDIVLLVKRLMGDQPKETP
jgi:hypothetical protein